jgi:hypothetical protein
VGRRSERDLDRSGVGFLGWCFIVGLAGAVLLLLLELAECGAC